MDQLKPRLLPPHLVVTGFVVCASSPIAAQPSSCDAADRALWSCQSGRRVYALCASPDLHAATGSLQYRASRLGAVPFVVPAERRHPRGLFTLSLLPRGARLRFTHDGHTYDIVEPLSGPTRISVSKGTVPVAEVTCQQASDTLTRTDMQAFLRQVGIFP